MIANRHPGSYFLLVFALSIPLWLIGSATTLQLLPGLPVSSLMAFCPMVAVSVLGYREGGTNAVADIFKSSLDFRRVSGRAWYIPAVLLMPCIGILVYGLMRLLHWPLPMLQVKVLSAFVMALMFSVAAMGEELGWSGYAIDPLQDRWNALGASILLGLVWAVWHIVPFIQAGRSPVWILCQCITLVASRILIVWLYNNTNKSVFVAALSHAMINVSWQLFPNNGSHYDPRLTGLVTTLAAVIVTLYWGPRTLVRSRNA